MRTLLLIALALALPACASGTAPPDNSMYEMGRDEYGPVPPPDPTRRVSVQDCTQRIEADGGNLYCR
jgi:uncharacterized lipoprotein YmbA